MKNVLDRIQATLSNGVRPLFSWLALLSFCLATGLLGPEARPIEAEGIDADVITTTIALPGSLFSTSITETEYVTAVVALPFNINATPAPQPNLSAFVPNLITAISTLLAASMGFTFTYFVSRSSRRYEWGKFLWDKYQTHYLALYATIKKSTDPDFIARHLEATAPDFALPPIIEQHVATLLNDLRQATTPEQKVQKRAEFLRKYEAFIKHPWQFL